MRLKFINIFIASILVISAILLVIFFYRNQYMQKNIVNNNDKEIKATIDNEDIIKNYITSFLVNGFSKYYQINSIKYKLIDNKVDNSKIEVVFLTTMNTTTDPNTVPYVIAAKEKAQKENNPEKKEVLQKEYESLAGEYEKPSDTNFIFKLTANLINGKIDKKSIKLFLQNPLNTTEYIPAEEILPKK